MGENGKAIVDAIDVVTGSTIDKEEIMQAATRTLTQGLVSDGNQITDMFKIAQAMAVGFGGSAVQAFEAESMAIETGMTRQLKRQGIVVDFTAAYEKYAISVHKSVDALTEDEQVEARRNEVLEKGAILVSKIGDATNDQASKIQRLERGWTELTDVVKEYLATVATGAMDTFDILANGEVKLADAFHGTAARMKQDVIDGKMSLDDYNKGIEGMGRAISDANRSDNWNNLAVELTASEKLTQNVVDGFRILKQQASDAADQTKRMADEAARISGNRATDLTKLSPTEQQAAVKAYEGFQTKLSDVELKGDTERAKIVSETADQIDKLEADSGQKRTDIISKFATDEANRLTDMQDKRIDILTSYSEAEQQITDKQNKDRLALAQSFGIETERMEQDHQRNMQRLTEDHGRRLSKLADSRDALGIEDEQANYQIEARRAEEDYQTQASRRNEDYARQLSDLNAAAEEQRQARTKDKEKQLADLNDQFVKQDTRYQAAYQKQLDDLTKSTGDQAQKLKEAEYKKLTDLDASTKSEHDKAVTEWETWRKDHGLFLQGEKALYDDYLKHLHDQLQLYMNGGTAPTAAPLAGHLAAGGWANAASSYLVGEHGPEILRMGSRGGYVEANGGNQFKVEINIGGSSASLPDIKSAVYEGIKEVMQAARR
jgi:hypothetical protein